MPRRKDDEIVEGEVVLDVNEGDPAKTGTRKIRVYDKRDGDFVIEIPAGATVTFGYFNPAAAGSQTNEFGGRGGQTMKTTSLRVYEKGARSSQIACFLGVDGFRDMAIEITRLRQKVVVETNYENDGDGYIKHHAEERKQLVRVVEDEGEDAIF